MPVYIRKNISYTPPSLANFVGDDIEDDFVSDPEQIRDTLPQPYRMLDKVLETILDEVWETISSRENERLTESNRIRPPRYEGSFTVKNLAKTCCLCGSEDGEMIFGGVTNGLVAMDSSSQSLTSTWEEDKAEIVNIQTTKLTTIIHLIATIDDMGTARLFAYLADRFQLLKVLNEQDGSTNRAIVSQCVMSVGGDYLGIVYENPGNSTAWLEVQRLPKAAWIKELESLLPKKEVSSMHLDKMDGLTMTVEVSEENQTQDTDGHPQKQKSGMALNKGSRKQSKGGNDKLGNSLQVDNLSLAASTTHIGPGVDNSSSSDKKFSPLTLVLKCKPPPPQQGFSYKAPSTVVNKKGNGTMSIAQACKAVDGSDVIGTGAQHLMTQQHMDLRQLMFEQLHENVKKFIPKNEDNSDDKGVISHPTFHFCNAGRLLTTGIDQPGQADKPLAVCVWWNGSSQLCQYSLLKSAKDVEYKSDIVWPFSSTITCTAISPCTSLLAVGLDSGNLVVWDRFVGVERGVFDISNSPVKEIEFIEPSVCGQDKGGMPGFGSKTAFFLAILCQDGSLYLKRCGGKLSEIQKPIQLYKSCEEGDRVTYFQSLTSIPRIILHVHRDGSIYLQDIFNGQLICQPDLPPSHIATSPWRPVIAVGGGGRMLYVQGEEKEALQCESETTPSIDSSLFVFQLRSFPSLDTYWNTPAEKIPFVLPGTINSVVDELLKKRYSEQSGRKSRLENRWEKYMSELEGIKEHRINIRMASAKSSFNYIPGF